MKRLASVKDVPYSPCIAAAQVVDFYLDDARAAERTEIIKLVNQNDPKSDELLRGYMREAQSAYLYVHNLVFVL